MTIHAPEPASKFSRGDGNYVNERCRRLERKRPKSLNREWSWIGPSTRRIADRCTGIYDATLPTTGIWPVRFYLKVPGRERD